MEASRLQPEARGERVELLSGIRDQVGPLPAAPADAAVVQLGGHGSIVYTRRAGRRRTWTYALLQPADGITDFPRT
jgi:hypothetical protein